MPEIDVPEIESVLKIDFLCEGMGKRKERGRSPLGEQEREAVRNAYGGLNNAPTLFKHAPKGDRKRNHSISRTLRPCEPTDSVRAQVIHESLKHSGRVTEEFAQDWARIQAKRISICGMANLRALIKEVRRLPDGTPLLSDLRSAAKSILGPQKKGEDYGQANVLQTINEGDIKFELVVSEDPLHPMPQLAGPRLSRAQVVTEREEREKKRQEKDKKDKKKKPTPGTSKDKLDRGLEALCDGLSFKLYTGSVRAKGDPKPPWEYLKSLREARVDLKWDYDADAGSFRWLDEKRSYLIYLLRGFVSGQFGGGGPVRVDKGRYASHVRLQVVRLLAGGHMKLRSSRGFHKVGTYREFIRVFAVKHDLLRVYGFE